MIEAQAQLRLAVDHGFFARGSAFALRWPVRLLQNGFRAAAIIVFGGLACGPHALGTDGGSTGVAGGSGTSCTTNVDCSSGAYCKKVGCHDATGTCQPMGAQGCPAFYTPVCGCDGKDYYCPDGSHGEGVSVDYLGHCDNGSAVSCDENHACPAEQTCFDDPRTPCPPGSSCPGICLATYGYPCGPAQPLDGGTPTLRCTGGFCAVPRANVCDGGECTVCAAGQIRCDQGTTCPEHQVCLPSVGCGAATCPSYCVRL